MATRQYIGARYVPKFYENSVGSAEWTANTAYEPLTIVTRNGNSYTSKKEVPATAGAPEAAPEYWASTGIYNQQIDIYREEVATYKTAVDNLQEDYDDFKEGYNTLKYRKFIFIGDSYAQAYTPEGMIQGWPDRVAAKLQLASGQWYKSAYGAIGFGRAQEGVTFTSLITDISVDDPESITDIVVCGGYNEQGSVSPVLSGIASFKAVCDSRFPNARVHIGFVGYGKTFDGVGGNITMNAYRQGAVNNGCEYLNNVEYALYDFYTFFSSDGFHPNDTGLDRLAIAIANAIMSGSADVRAPYTTIDIPTGSIMSLERANSFGCDYNNGMVTCYLLSRMIVTPASAYSYGIANGRTEMTLGTITSGFLYGNDYRAPIINITAMVHNGSNFFIMPGRLRFYKGEIRLALIGTNDTNSNWRTLDSISDMEIFPFEASFSSHIV